jgi:hypothetical protein
MNGVQQQESDSASFIMVITNQLHKIY